jgi:hypothetical protein
MKNQVETKLNETHQILVYADEVNLLGDNINTIQKYIQLWLETHIKYIT